MRKGKFIICILVIILLSFSFISCGKQAATTTTVKVAEVTTTTLAKGLWDEDNQATTKTNESTTTIMSSTEFSKLVEEAFDNGTTTTTKETTTTTISAEEALNNYKLELKDYLSTVFNAELTKFSYDQDNSIIIIAYNTKWAVDETMKKELYDITKSLIEGGWILVFKTALGLDSTSQFGKTVKANMTYDNMIKLQNLEMSYEDWLKVAIK